jgi:tetratricopeptide (TPR) repeat protein
MRISCKLIYFVVAVLILAATAFSQTSGDQFKTAVASFQRSATNENALKVIELFKQLDPPPAVPEEAREPFVMANTMLKKASDASNAAKAVESYDKAIYLAPWWADAYFNRALARETAGQFDKAIDDLKLYLAFKLTDAERREAQDKVYSLKAEAEMSASRNAKAAEVAAIDAKARLFEGD